MLCLEAFRPFTVQMSHCYGENHHVSDSSLGMVWISNHLGYFQRRQNGLLLQEKENKEKELLNQIIDEADDYKADFYKRKDINRETAKANNREKEKVS